MTHSLRSASWRSDSSRADTLRVAAYSTDSLAAMWVKSGSWSARTPRCPTSIRPCACCSAWRESNDRRRWNSNPRLPSPQTHAGPGDAASRLWREATPGRESRGIRRWSGSAGNGSSNRCPKRTLSFPAQVAPIPATAPRPQARQNPRTPDTTGRAGPGSLPSRRPDPHPNRDSTESKFPRSCLRSLR